MARTRAWLARAAGIFRRRRCDRDLADELNSHLEAHIAENIRAGMTRDDARRDALLKLGGLAQATEACQSRQGLPFVETTMQDLRFAFRMLRKTPGFAAAAILTLALGIGANTAIFSVLNAVILKPLEYQQPERLMKIASSFPNYDDFWISTPEYLEFREWTRAFSSVGAYQMGESNMTAAERPQRVRMMQASDDLFKTLRAGPLLGRTFDATDTRPGGAAVAILSEGVWRSSFGGNPAVVGSTAEIDGVRRTIVGVMPREFDVADLHVQLWLPLVIDPATANRGGHNAFLIGRLADGVTLQAARAEMQTLLTQWRERSIRSTPAGAPPPPGRPLHAPDDKAHRLHIDPLQARIVGTATTSVWVLQGAVVLVLLIACANLSTLLLSRAESRRREFAVRAALGATLGRLLRQSIAEGCLLSTIGGGLGIGVAVAGLRTLVTAFPASLPRSGNITIDWRVLAFTLGVALATGVIFGIAPLLHLAPQSAATALKEGGQRTAGGRHLLRRSLVVCEVALSVALVVGAGLLIRTVGKLTTVDAGFDRSRLITFAVSLPTAKYSTPVARRQFYQRLMDQLGATPGVTSLAAMSGLPPYRTVNANTTMFENYTPPPGQPSQDVDYYQAVTTGYLATMGIPVVDGRAFTDADMDGSPVVMVNQTMARLYWPGQTAVGHRLRPCCNPATPWMTIVGVIRDVKQGGVEKKTGSELYFHAGRNAQATMNVVIRTPLAPAALANTIQRTVASLDPTLPVVGLRAMDEVFDEAIGRPRLLAQLLTIFAALALLLSTIGTYGVLSYMVTERRREIGIRVALGATRQSVMRMVLGQGLGLTFAGVAIGLVLAIAAGRLLASLLFGVTAIDPVTITAVVALIGTVALIACFVPATSATRVDPMVALRVE
jgi:putative ABC transport system permease protein